jgi:hypothetical protein
MTPSRIPALLAAALAALLLLAATAAAKTVTKTCKGDTTCKASFSLAGGASNERLVIELPGTSYHNPRVSVSPRSLRGAYDLSRGRFRLGGSEYVVTLDAVGSIRRGTLTFTFVPRD